MQGATLRSLAGAATLAGLVAACGGDTPVGPGDMANDRITITNNASALASRVVYHGDVDVPVDTGGGPRAAPGFTLTLIAEISPPAIGSETLQATSVQIKGNFAIVGYNMQGAQYLGGIDVINITNKKRPVLESEGLFADSDINSVSTENGLVYAAQATEDPSFAAPSALEVIRLLGHHLILEGNERVGLPSFAGTSAFSIGGNVFATSGDQGGLSVLTGSPITSQQYMELHDARWVHAADGKIVVVQGTPGQLSVYDEASLTLENTFPFPGADVPESKSTVDVAGAKAFVAAGPEGVQILSVSTGTIVGVVPRPDPTALGLPPSVVVTNAVAVDGDLLFISNGEAGVYVAQADEPFANTGSEDPQQLNVLGQLQFASLQSVNHVAFRGDYLILATGLGGLKIVQVGF